MHEAKAWVEDTILQPDMRRLEEIAKDTRS